MDQHARRPLSRQRGQTLVEYALIIALVGCIVIATLHILGDRVWSVFECAGQAIDHPITANCGRGGRL